MEKQSILIIDDEPNQLKTLSGYLRKKRSFQVHEAENGQAGLALIQDQAADIVLTDMRMPVMDGLSFLRAARKIRPGISVVMMTAYGSVEDAVAAMKEGAADYLQKPIDLDQLDLILERVLKNRRLIAENETLREALQTRADFSQIIAAGPEMETILNMASRAARSRATVLIRGESGTGKEVLARAIHMASPRKDRPFIAVNMAAIPENLLESELFGHEKGAFTGAERQRKGRFELADGGTLFVDEIGEVPPSVQVKLLRVLQEMQFERIGGNESLRVDVRVVAATNQDLEALITEGRFREDLYYRLNVVCLKLPPLRDRREEIPRFVDHFIRKYAAEEDRPVTGISQPALDALMAYDYPGNIRELENIVQRAVVMTLEDIIGPDDLPPAIFGKRSVSVLSASSNDLVAQVELLEQKLIREALDTADGNQSRAARTLGISERHLRYKLKKYGMK
ncbi:sigma-54-dependent Fis family transcriptional regulator [bacterium]|nr:sigma-54-dependent Fis family transcriptional regulator [bacterium]